MKWRLKVNAFAVLSLVLLVGCSKPHGQSRKNSESIAPNQLLQFDVLYAQNCAGCHGVEGRGGAAISLANPVYLAIIEEASMRRVISNGVHGTSMPAFSQNAGGMLTDPQIDVITHGILSHWGSKGMLNGATPPPYATRTVGSVAHGEFVYGKYCVSCHGPGGRGSRKGSAITDRSFLALVSDQGLRTIVITGRPELGAPDWRGNIPGARMSNQEITDVVAWLASYRAQNTEQPYAASNSPR
jgi:cytochrome c oxidase cbb3-type subunit III